MGQGARILSGWKLHLQKTTQKHRWSRGTTRWTRTSFPTGTLRIRGAVKSGPGQRSFVGRPANGGCCQRRASLLQSATPELPPRAIAELPPRVTAELPPRVTTELPPRVMAELPPRVTTELPPRVT